MGEITSGISILLGSAVVSTIITTIFNQYNNRKNNTLKYITEERKKWRDTIRLISEKIQACEFSGQDEKNIEKYLVELELNINSCGWGNKKDIKEDAYIWDEINQVKKVDNEGDFKKHKELLIYYISIMLKEDWDRSKNEVNGYSQAFVEILTTILINSAICCLYLHIALCGYFVIITSEKMDAADALDLYKSRDASEKLFREDKTFLGNRTMRCQSNEALHAKIFIEFVALIIRNRIHFLLKEQMLKAHQKENYMTVPAAVRELEKIEIIRQTDGEYYRDYAVTATQKSILKAFGLSEINVGKQAVDINEDLRSCNTKET